MRDDAVWWLRLAALNETARGKQRLLARFPSPQELFAGGSAAWGQAGIAAGTQDRLRRAATAPVEPDLERLAVLGVELVPRDDVRFPPLLASIDDPPVLLFVRGLLPAASRPCVALVGTRRTSPYGELVAEQLGRELAEAGVGVISGLAAGIDAAAHRGAVIAGGYTAAVLGTGIEGVYPRENASLYDQVAEKGALLSEFPLGTPPRAWHFPLRNRVISGLCRAVVVVQAPLNSGALITATLATEQNREVMAVPGNITDGRHAGCHALIRDGASLVRGVDDILEALKLERVETARAAPESRPAPTLDAKEARVAAAVKLVPQSIDDLIEATGLATPEVQSALVTLELKQVVRRLPGNRFVRAT